MHVSGSEQVRGHTVPQGDLPSLLDDYEVADLIEVDGRIPLNFFTFRRTFGDQLSPWLVSRMTGRETSVADRARPHYGVIGSVINQGTDQSIFWGTGVYGTEARSEVPAGATYTAVRGPLTRAKLSASKGFGIDVPDIYGDPALLLPLFFRPEVPITHEYGVVVGWSDRAWAKAKYGDGVKLIDFARDDVESVLRDMLSCRRIVASALHGLIVADAYGIPSAWLASDSPRGGVFTFYDYLASVNKVQKPHKVHPHREPMTVDRLSKAFTFNDQPIDFDYRALLDACPFLRRKGTGSPDPLPVRESGASLRDRLGTKELLPSLGYFGGIAANYLSFPVKGPVVKIALFLSGRSELDLRGVELFRRGRRVAVDEAGVKIRQSSIGAGRRGNPFAYGVIRSEKEMAPWWSATFVRPIDADEIRVYNRRDGWGVRSRTLTVAAAGVNGRLQTVGSVDSDRVVEATLRLIERLTGIVVAPSVLDSAQDSASVRREVVAALARSAGAGLITREREEQRLLGSLLPREPRPDGTSLTDHEWALLGHLLAAERLRVPSTGTSMQAFHRLLDTRAALSRLETEVNRAGKVLGTPQAVLTRHGFTDIGALQQNSSAYLGLIERASAVLEQCGHPAMLAYGTLLGAVREGNFLAHDDDVDLLIPTRAANREEVEVVLADLAEKLRQKGWRVTRPNSYTNFHLTEPSTKLHVDVFPLLVDGDRTSLHMEKMRLRDIPTKIVLPPRSYTFLGHEMLVPADPEGFLRERYGDGWGTPDPFYDWTWKLKD